MTRLDKAWEIAVKSGDAKTAQDLLRAGIDVNSRDRYGQTGLMLAALHGQREVVELLIANSADLNVTAKYNLSALMLAVINGHTGIASMLARAGADRTILGSGAPGFYGKTAYDLAVARGMLQLASELQPN